MKEIVLMYSRSTKQTNATVLALLDGLSSEAREEDRKSYYKSLSGLISHILDATVYFHGLFRSAFPAALSATVGMAAPEGRLADGQWTKLKADLVAADRATVDLIQSLSEAELSHPVELDWYDGKPAAVPLYFLAQQLAEHGTHHRGQISQILDELGVEHDFSGIGLECLPR